MSPDQPDIRVERLSKRYRIGLAEQKSETLAGSLFSWMRAPLDNYRRLRALSHFEQEGGRDDVVWALRDVSFDVQPGEVVGIIGRNGAGKSTLLKILSRITEPTDGHADIRGRVSSLLEVGTGFHAELTGRENVYLNGTVLGMTKAEVDRKYDEIVAFSGVEKFIDTPVKRYSSGMKVRLAFSVAAHLEPEILLIDEVLAVGDVAFQRKCLGKMDEVARGGRTVLFVSHQMEAIRNLCSRTICMEDGGIAIDDATDRAVAHYLEQNIVEGAEIGREQIEARIEGTVKTKMPSIRFEEISLRDAHGTPRNSLSSDEDINITVRFRCLRAVHDGRVLVHVVDERDRVVLTTQNVDDPEVVFSSHIMDPGEYEAQVTIPGNTFGENVFYITVHLINPKHEHLRVERVLRFEVRFKGYNNIQYGSFAKALIRPRLDWTVTYTGRAAANA